MEGESIQYHICCLLEYRLLRPSEDKSRDMTTSERDTIGLESQVSYERQRLGGECISLKLRTSCAVVDVLGINILGSCQRGH